MHTNCTHRWTFPWVIPGTCDLVFIHRGVVHDSEAPMLSPFTQRAPNTVSVPGTVLDVERSENQTQGLPPGRPHSSERGRGGSPRVPTSRRLSCHSVPWLFPTKYTLAT